MKLIIIFTGLMFVALPAKAEDLQCKNKTSCIINKPVFLLFRSYMAMVKNSFGSRMFRNYYYKEKNGKTVDVLGNGNLSCAYYASSILYHFKLVDDTYVSVGETVEALKKNGWKNIDKPVPGSVIVWDKMFFKSSGKYHMHIGFYLGHGRAMSNSSRHKYPAIHHWQRIGGYRKIIEILWNDKLNQ